MTTIQDKQVPEILAPAGGRQQFFAALNGGADAVYLGMKEFNARGRAENFTLEDLEELVPLAKERGMKVLVTLNILLKDIEFDVLIKRLSRLQFIGIEAVIVQDLGVARLIRENFPKIRMHASTQMAIHNLSGVIKARNLGFKRVVVARELTIQELKLIKTSTKDMDVELEGFCHGSLCYSYSGLCFFSGAEDARSGNRGECAYTCRKPYKIVSEEGHGFLFSMKDLDTSKDLEKLVEAGVDTLKIEGRKKDAQYVGTVVGLYRKRLNEIFGRDTSPSGNSRQRNFAKDMSFSFHRETSSFFMNGRYHENVIDLNNPTHKGLQVGVVESCLGRHIEFRSKESLEMYDGIRIDRQSDVYHAKPQHGVEVASTVQQAQKKYQNKTCQFSLRSLMKKGKNVPKAQAADKVRIQIPEGLPLPKVGDPIFKVRSNELKRSTEELLSQSKGKHSRWRNIDLQLNLEKASDESLVVYAEARLGEQLLWKRHYPVEAQSPKDAKSSLRNDMERLFTKLGDFNILAQVSVSGDCHAFVPRSLLKRLKKSLGQDLNTALEEFSATTSRSAQDSLMAGRQSLKSQDSSSYNIKIDRLEYLEYLTAIQRDISDLEIAEISFEPKRSLLGNIKAGDLVDQLMAGSESLGAKLRFVMPTVIRAWDEVLLKKWAQAFYEKGGRRFEVGNLGAIELLKKWDFAETLDLSSDFTLYVLNTQAVEEFASLGIKRVCLSVEDDRECISSKLEAWPVLNEVEPELILYKDTPLFIAEACSLTALHKGCPTAKVCGYRSLEVENDEGERFIAAHESCKSIIYGKEAYSISHHRSDLEGMGVSKFRLDFLTRPYDLERMKDCVLAAVRSERVSGTHEANYSRTLL